MREELIESTPRRKTKKDLAPSGGPSCAAAARIANVALTAQVQFAYNCATAAAAHAQRAADYVETMWPDTPLRTMVVAAYRVQLLKSEQAALAVLRHARERCGLAFAPLNCPPA